MRDDLRAARQVHNFTAALVDAGVAAAPVGRAGCLAEARQAQQAAGCRLRYRRSGRGRGLDRTGRCSRFAAGLGLGRTCGRARAIARCGIVHPLDSRAKRTFRALVQTAQDGDALDLVVEPRELVSDPFQRRLSGVFNLVKRTGKSRADPDADILKLVPKALRTGLDGIPVFVEQHAHCNQRLDSKDDCTDRVCRHCSIQSGLRGCCCAGGGSLTAQNTGHSQHCLDDTADIAYTVGQSIVKIQHLLDSPCSS